MTRGVSALARYIHPEFGGFCLTTRFRRDIRVIAVSVLIGTTVGWPTTGGSTAPSCLRSWRASTPTWCAGSATSTDGWTALGPRTGNSPSWPPASPGCSGTGPGSPAPGDEDDKSPVTGDRHAGICGSRGLRCPRLPDPAPPVITTHRRSSGPSLTGGYVVRSAQSVLRPPPTPFRQAIHFPRSSVIGRHAPTTPSPQVAGPGRPSPVPAATI